MSNNIDDNYVENTIIKSLTMILILMNHSPWRPYNKHGLSPQGLLNSLRN